MSLFEPVPRPDRGPGLLARLPTVAVVLLGLALLAGGGLLSASLLGSRPDPAASRPGRNRAVPAATTPPPSPSPLAGARPVACGATRPSPQPHRAFTSEPPMRVDRAQRYVLTMTTSCGVITAELYADRAPRTVNSFTFLAAAGYFDGTPCHRTSDQGLVIVQCGDPTGTGSGGPGYAFPDENLAGATYPRGTVAMANAGPGTNGSQFFVVGQDSLLPPSYTVWGRVVAGLDVLDRIIALGNDQSSPAGGGRPLHDIYVEAFTVTPG